MKRTIILLALIASIVFANEMFLVEDYTEEDITFEVSDADPITMASISFTLDREAFVTVTTGGIIKHMLAYYVVQGNDISELYNCSWVTMNGTKLQISVGSPNMNGSYVFALDPGNYEFELQVLTFFDTRMSPLVPPDYDTKESTVRHPRIQALIILSDTAENNIAEKPPERDDPIQPSLITSGPSVNVPGCVEVRDITGRTVNCEISGDRVMLSTLSRGTYFIERNDGHSVKLVKM